MAVTFAHSRVNQELAKEGILPFSKFWASTWPMGAPSAGLLLHFIPSFIMLIAIPFGDAFNFIIDVEQYARALVYFLVVIGLFVLRKRKPFALRPFKVWNSVAGFFLIGQLAVLIAPWLRPPKGKGDTQRIPYWVFPLIGLFVLGGGVIYWALWKRAFPRLFKYRLEEEKHVLEDGTVVVQYEKKKI
jgi:amino acid transporter